MARKAVAVRCILHARAHECVCKHRVGGEGKEVRDGGAFPNSSMYTSRLSSAVPTSSPSLHR